MKKTLAMSILTVGLLVATGCSTSGDGSSGGSSDDGGTPLEISKVNQLKLTDVNGASLSGATGEVKVASKAPSLGGEPSKSGTFTVGKDGLVTVDDLGEGLYSFTVVYDGITITTTLEITAENYQKFASLMTPISVDDKGKGTLIKNAIIASISGTVLDSHDVAISNAQVSVSGGAATNGAFVTAVTDENGAYTLLINANDSLKNALLSATLSASAAGYITQVVSDYKIHTNTNTSGINFKLQSAGKQTAIYSEDFEADNSGWTTNKLTGSNGNNNWHIHTNKVTGINKAFTDNAVKLAPDDTSAGAIPSPLDSQCFWYGNGVTGDDTFGNFLGAIGQVSKYNGGMSVTDNSGELISPAIDLTTVSGDIKLSFDTFWEIESVNPNLNGYDIMTVSVSTDDGVTWRDLARLNPLSDPKTSIDRSAIPFSNTGYNSAPTWLTQEAIPLVDIKKVSLSGQTVKLKFTFKTVDGKFNGFRGWMIDNIEITKGKGTYPLYEDINQSIDGPDDGINSSLYKSSTRIH